MFWNQIKTAILLAAMSGLLLLIGSSFGGSGGLFIALVIALVINLLVYFYSDKIVLKMYKAQPLDQNKYENVYEMVEEMCHRANMPMPKLWYLPTEMANAFATGRNPQHASVAVTQGILDVLDESELRGVLAHELSHVKNRDILVATVAASLAMAIGYLADMIRWTAFFGGSGRDRNNRGNVFVTIFIAMLMPFAAMLIQLAISRSREYLADESGAKISDDPLALASALEKLHFNAKTRHAKPRSNAEGVLASLFILNPFSSESLFKLFSTHPPMKKRIEKLHKIAEKF